MVGGVRPPASIFRCRCSGFSSCTGRPEPRQRRGERRERPPCFNRWRGSAKGGCQARCQAPCQTLPPPFGGSLPSLVIHAGRLTGPRRGRDDEQQGATRCLTDSSTPFSSSAASAPRPPGRGRARSPRPIPWRSSSATTPRTFTRAVVAWYYLAPGVAAFLAGAISHQHITYLVRPDERVSLGLRSRLPKWPLSPTADGPAIVVGEVHHPVRALPRVQTPEWLTIPERGLYTGVASFRGRRLRQDLRLYAPVRAPAPQLASQAVPSGEPPRSSLK